jgi:hypothetical protein
MQLASSRLRTLVIAAATALAGGGVVAAGPAPAVGLGAGTTRYAAPGGSDTGSGAVDAPFATIAHGLAVTRPGDTLLVRGGTYAERITSVVLTPGTASAPVRVAAYPGERPVVAGLLWLKNASYWTFDGINVTWSPANTASEHMVKLTDGVGWRFTNAEVWDAHSFAAILVAGTPSGWSLDHLRVHDTVPSNGTNQDHLLYVNAGTGGGVVEHNLLTGSPNGRAIKVGPPAAGAGATANLTIRFNTMRDNLGPSNVQLAWETSNVDITRNVMVHPGAGRSAVTAYQLNGAGNVVSDNVVWDAADVLDRDVAGLADGGGNVILDPQLDAGGRPTNPDAAAYGWLAADAALPSPGPVVPPVPPPADGYRMVAADGGVFAFGSRTFLGSTGARRLNQPIVGMAATPAGAGYWLVARDGGIFSFGDAAFYGSTGAVTLSQPIVGMAATPTGHGYWLAARDGGIFAFGDAAFYGSTGARHLSQPVVGMAATPTGHGYWLAAADGGIFAFGDAEFYGSTGGRRLTQPVVGLAATPTGHGYWLAARDGGIFAFGDAAFYGSTGARHLSQPVVGMAATPTGDGYWLAAADGGIFAFGDAEFYGSTGGHRLTQPVVAAAA